MEHYVHPAAITPGLPVRRGSDKPAMKSVEMEGGAAVCRSADAAAARLAMNALLANYLPLVIFFGVGCSSASPC